MRTSPGCVTVKSNKLESSILCNLLYTVNTPFLLLIFPVWMSIYLHDQLQLEVHTSNKERVCDLPILTERKRFKAIGSHNCLPMPCVCVRVRCCSFFCLIVLFNYRLWIEWPLFYSEQLQQEAVPRWITLAWTEGLVAHGILLLKTNQADISALVIVRCYSNAATVTRHNSKFGTHTHTQSCFGHV